MPFSKARVRATALLACAFVGSMLVTVSYAPTLYRLFCGATGYGGTTRRASGPVNTADKSNPLNVHLRVNFDANVAPGLNWKFKPEQRFVDVTIGMPVTVYFDATNLSKQVNVARAVYNVTPSAVAPYFYKIQCFCFTEEKLDPGQSAQMPVVFYIDDAMIQDASEQPIKEVTLSYTFYDQKGLAQDAVTAARDLKAGSMLEARQKTPPASQFENDAIRRQEP